MATSYEPAFLQSPTFTYKPIDMNSPPKISVNSRRLSNDYFPNQANSDLPAPTKCCDIDFFCYLTLLEHYDIIHAAQGHKFPDEYPIELKDRQELDQKRLQEAIAISPATNDQIQMVTDMQPLPVENVDDSPMLEYPLQQNDKDLDSASRALINISYLVCTHLTHLSCSD
jgi:hypothetical protein